MARVASRAASGALRYTPVMPMSEESDDPEVREMAMEATERELARIERERGPLGEQEREKLHETYLSKYLYEARLKQFVETEYVPKGPKYDFEDASD